MNFSLEKDCGGQATSHGGSGGATPWTTQLGEPGDFGIVFLDLKGDPALFTAAREEAAGVNSELWKEFSD